MSTEETTKDKQTDETVPNDGTAEGVDHSESGDSNGGSGGLVDEEAPESGDHAAVPNQFGYRRFVYAAYFAAGIAVAFILSKVGDLVWHRLATWKPQVGEPREDILMPLAGVLGAAVAFYYWKKADSRKYVEEVASELSQVTWPTRQEVTNSTTVVIIATAFSTVFFALMDRFWGFVTNLVYGAA